MQLSRLVGYLNIQLNVVALEEVDHKNYCNLMESPSAIGRINLNMFIILNKYIDSLVFSLLS